MSDFGAVVLVRTYACFMVNNPMQENEDKETKKHPIEMTSDELLDYAIAPEVAEELKKMARPEEEDCDSESD